MNKTLSGLWVGSLCMGLTLGALAGEEKHEPKPEEHERVAAKEAEPVKGREVKDERENKEGRDGKEGREKIGVQRPLENVDLKVIAPATFRELDVTERVRLNESDLEIKIRSSIRRLATPGSKDAETDLLDVGGAAVPYLIEALGPNDYGYPIIAFNVGGHIKADSSRGTRERTLADACSEVLTTLITNRSNYAGELPTLNQKAWQDWWLVNREKVTFGN